jgi:predicted nucleic acid-binding protein
LSLNARSYLFDAGALFLFHSGDARVKTYFDRVFSSRAAGFVSEINLAELYYKTIEKFGLDTAETWYLQIRQSSHLRVIAPGEAITRSAAIWKSTTKNISLADCYALATTQEMAQVMITTDSALARVNGVKVIHIPVD